MTRVEKIRETRERWWRLDGWTLYGAVCWPEPISDKALAEAERLDRLDAQKALAAELAEREAMLECMD